MTNSTTKQRGKLPSMASKLGSAINVNQQEKIVELTINSDLFAILVADRRIC